MGYKTAEQKREYDRTRYANRRTQELEARQEIFLDDDPAIAEVFTEAILKLEDILVAAIDTAPTVC